MAPSPAKKTTDAVPADQDALSVTELAKGVLARDFRPRAASVRRLAEAVLAKQESPAKPKKKKKKSAGKKRRLAKIPGQKGKKKKD